MPRQLPDLANAVYEPLAVVPDDHAAVHEIGHAIAAFLAGGFVHWVSLETTPPEALATCWDDEAKAIFALGAPAATLYKYNSIDAAHIDIAVAKHHAQLAGISYEAIARKTMELIAEAWPAIEIMTVLLIEKRTLSAVEFGTAMLGPLDDEYMEVVRDLDTIPIPTRCVAR